MSAESRETPTARPKALTASTRATATLSEAAIVLGVPVGLVLGREVWVRIRDGAIPIRPPFTDSRLLATLGAEVVLAILLGAWLRRRDWSPRTELGRPAPFDLLRGGVLWAMTFAVVTVANVAFRAVVSSDLASAREATLSGKLSLPVVAVALLINPLFEETLWLGYAIPTLARHAGVLAAAAVSIGLRVAVHGNQGLLAATSILPVGVVWTTYYVRSRRLWPVVVAHVINNAIGLSAFVGN